MILCRACTYPRDLFMIPQPAPGWACDNCGGTGTGAAYEPVEVDLALFGEAS